LVERAKKSSAKHVARISLSGPHHEPSSRCVSRRCRAPASYQSISPRRAAPAAEHARSSDQSQ
jgi:hypothetical protein